MNEIFNKRERPNKKIKKRCYLFFKHRIKKIPGQGSRCIFCGRLKSQCGDYINIS